MILAIAIVGLITIWDVLRQPGEMLGFVHYWLHDGDELRHKVLKVFTCPFCTGFWASLVVAGVFVLEGTYSPLDGVTFQGS